MRDKILRCVSVLLGCAMVSGWALAAPSARALPDRYAPGSLDGEPVVVEHPFDGTTWSAWAYRNGAEYDVAVSVRGADGTWSAPTFFGLDDGLDQVDPSLAFDATGTVYLAFAVRETGAVMVALRIGGTRAWVGPGTWTADGVRASHPALKVVGDRVVLAHRVGDGIAIGDFAIVPGLAVTTHGIQEGPDVIDPLGRQADRGDSDDRPGWGGSPDGPRSSDANDPTVRSLRSRVPDDRRN